MPDESGQSDTGIFSLPLALAVPLGVAIGRWEVVKDVSEGLISALRPVPPLAWVPLAMAWLKIGLASMVFHHCSGCVLSDSAQHSAGSSGREAILAGGGLHDGCG